MEIPFATTRRWSLQKLLAVQFSSSGGRIITKSRDLFISLVDGMCLARRIHMARELFCDHCERTLTSKAYRVISEDPGGVLLNMLVCHPCNQKARELGLETREIKLDELQLKRG
jgi:hypothetical protein